jgi:(1->4)-alpha-D-glucan 1-alpha-D-glucosylmutase
MTGLETLLERMATLVGISPYYKDAFGRSVETTPETRRALLTGLGLAVQNESEARDSLATLERVKSGIVPALLVVEPNRAADIALRGSAAGLEWHIDEEAGTHHEGRTSKSGTLQLPALPLGYHRLQIGSTAATVIAAPRKCWEPAALDGGTRLWGAAAQVYSLRSECNFGIGTYSDVAAIAQGVAGFGGAFLGLSPVHALFSSDRSKISPYSPSSRLFLETIHIDPTHVHGFHESGAAGILAQPDTEERVAQLRKAALLDHGAIWAIKRPLFDALWKHHQLHGDQHTFEAFRQSGGEALEAHATFEALSEYFQAQDRRWLGDWPEGYRSIHSSEVLRFRTEHASRVAFHAWLQWIADRQLADAAAKARAAGMPIGLYRDLAVGADRSGSEVWATPPRYAADLSVGAPPDPLGPQGQDWGLPPFNPLTLEADGLAAFRDLVSANMRHAGAIRIDHAFQLSRLFLIPSGASASQGAYVDFPFEAMLAVLRIESHRARCLVIAEDLGTAPEGFSDAIMESGVLSYRVQPFERAGAAFKRPAEYPRSALAVLTTHDLPTFLGWWRGLDIDLRQTFGVFDPSTGTREQEARRSDRQHFAQALAEQKLLPSSAAPEAPPLEGAVRYLARTTSALAALQIEDASGELNQANMPGLDAGHPNWRRRLSTSIESIMAPGSLLARLASAMAEEGRDARGRRGMLASQPPRATYRLQFHKDFTFDDAVEVIPYLAKLGISHVYASPIQAARPGSTHGYDIVDHSVINPELGGEDAFRRFSDALTENGLKLLLDIVPNHMGVGGADNPWWLSVLEWGKLSPFIDAFDIDWTRPGADGKLILPHLGDLYGRVLEKGDLKLTFDPAEGSFSVWHWEHRFPISPTTYPVVLEHALAALGDAPGFKELSRFNARFRALGECTPSRRPGVADKLKCELAGTARSSAPLRAAIDQAVAMINGVPGSPESSGVLHRLLEEQAYRLAYWRVASSDINYRRFFDINSLAGLRVEDQDTFERSHELLFRLVDEQRVDGFRIDHIDGLADPKGYAHALQRKVGPGFYVLVEKILEPGEELRSWPVAGTTGYDVLNLIDGVLLDTQTRGAFENTYRDASGLEGSYDALLRQAKTEISENSFASELGALVSDAKWIADADYRTRDYTSLAIRKALVDIIAALPVYRTYLDDAPPSAEDVSLIESSIETAKSCGGLSDHSVHEFIKGILLRSGNAKKDSFDSEVSERFRRRFQQLTGPVMAKSLEDTLFYRYGRLIALNEVGGDPGHFGISLAEFHESNAYRARQWPHAMIATATHDTKRGEDARARLLALSEMPDEWRAALDAWRGMVRPFLSPVGDHPSPDRNDQAILFQALLGAWPLELLDEDDAEALDAFKDRMDGYVLKALREAKRHTSWIDPNEAYEDAALHLLRALLEPGSEFLTHFRPLARRLAFLGMMNGLSRTILKMTIPGVPDIYQGTELWDFSLVDPDNRRPVDYQARARALDGKAAPNQLFSVWADGRIKQYVLFKLLEDRARNPAHYAEGDYQPLEVTGSRADHLIAFARHHSGEILAVIVPRHWSALSASDTRFRENLEWQTTAVRLPPGRWRDVMSSFEIETQADDCTASSLFASMPFCVLRKIS